MGHDSRRAAVAHRRPHRDTVTHQFVGSGGDGMRVLHGSIYLSNGRFNNVWRIQTAKVLDLVPMLVDDEGADLSISTRTAGRNCWSKTSTCGFPVS